MSKPVLFIQAGGTIDKVYPRGNNHHGYNFEIDRPAVLEIIERLCLVRTDGQWQFASVCKKDSLDMTTVDRRSIVGCIRSAQFDHIVVTHGTDTIHKTARVVARGVSRKTIVLTGANQPSMARVTDADLNLGMAIGAVPHLEAGVYIALNGIVVPWYDYVKN